GPEPRLELAGRARYRRRGGVLGAVVPHRGPRAVVARAVERADLDAQPRARIDPAERIRGAGDASSGRDLPVDPLVVGERVGGGQPADLLPTEQRVTDSVPGH